jgi:hypothetical protein
MQSIWTFHPFINIAEAFDISIELKLSDLRVNVVQGVSNNIHA